ncbi:MAG: hypothetical protein EOP52_02340 [Sphingobacteriales bacterium]|nr:MAG: hypothetical protein EOP52_02340 [Sphingobacteriales bacterium]
MPFSYYLPGLQPSNNLEQHLKGIDRTDILNGYTQPNEFLYTLLWIIGINLVFFVNYYYGLFNRPGADRKRWWGMHVLLAAALVYGIAFYKAYNMLHSGNVNVTLPFNEGDCHAFATESAVYSILMSLICTFTLKWGSRNNRYIPL